MTMQEIKKKEGAFSENYIAIQIKIIYWICLKQSRTERICFTFLHCVIV